MKMVCIETRYTSGSGEYKNLTIGKTYDVYVLPSEREDGGNMCGLVDDNGKDIECLLGRFISVKENRRNKLIELIED